MKKKNYTSIRILLLLLPFLLGTLTVFAGDFYRIRTKNEGVIQKENSQIDSVKVEGASLNFYKAGTVVYTNTTANIDRITFLSIPDFPEALWLVGDGSQAGWSAPRIKIESTGTGIYSADVYLGKGEFIFPTAESGWDENVVRPAVQHQSISLENGTVQTYTGGEDLKWEVTEAEEGKYTVTVDLNSMTASFEKLPDDLAFPARLSTVGASWAATSSYVPIPPVSGKPWLYQAVVEMSQSRLMFIDAGRQNDWWFDPPCIIRPLINNMETNLGQTGLFVSTTEDLGWSVSEAGNYKITINLKSHIILFEKMAAEQGVFLLGSGSQAGWDGPLIKLPSTGEGIYSMDTYLDYGELYFPTIADEWETQIIGPAAANQSISNSAATKYAENPQKWIVTEEESGKYNITVDLNVHTVTFTKLTPDVNFWGTPETADVYPDNVYLAGGGAVGGTWAHPTITIPKVGGETWIYSAECRIEAGNFQAAIDFDNWTAPGFCIKPIFDNCDLNKPFNGIRPLSELPGNYFWNNTVPGNYRVTFNLKSMRASFELLP